MCIAIATWDGPRNAGTLSIQGLAGVANLEGTTWDSPRNPGILNIQGLAGVATARGDHLGWSQESQDTRDWQV